MELRDDGELGGASYIFLCFGNKQSKPVDDLNWILFWTRVRFPPPPSLYRYVAMFKKFTIFNIAFFLGMIFGTIVSSVTIFYSFPSKKAISAELRPELCRYHRFN